MANDVDPTQPSADDNLPAVIAGADEVVVSVQSEGLLVAGDPEDVEAYLDRIRGKAQRAVDVMGIDKAALGNATGLAASATAFLGQSAKFVQLHPESVKAVRRGGLIPGTDGFFRMTTRGADKQFVSQLQWKPTNVNPARMMSLQMVAVQMALKTAIAEVEESVQRVEGKVEEVLRLANASRSGDVLGDRRTIDRMVAYLERHGSFSDADWSSIAAVGPALNRTVEQLRHHAERTLNSFDATKPIQHRAEFVVKAVDGDQLGETLSLLVVAQESLFKWQKLRIARVEATQPEHLQQVLDDARDLLTQELAADNALFQRAKEILEAVGKTDAIDGFRYWSLQDLQRALPVLRADLEQFAKARRAHIADWQDFKAPTARDAATAAIEMANETANLALETASEGIDKLSGYLGRARTKTFHRARVWRKGMQDQPADAETQLDESGPTAD